MTLYFIASFLPLFALAWSIYKKRLSSWIDIGLAGLAWLVVAGAALYVARPLLHGTAIGTGEAYNYSLSTADAVSQFRAGWFPVLAGQTEYAFNGRIHPLRTAPLLCYAAGLVDLLTFRQLSFWAIQNLVLALSLLGGALSTYFGLRQIIPGHPHRAALFALAYLLCPAVLAAVYSMDLYMTVVALPFVPLAIAGSVRTLSPERPGFAYVQISVGLAAAWLAHPPVALWLTISTVLFHLGRIVIGRFSNKEILPLIGTVLLAGVLSAFVFVSTFSITQYATIDAGRAPEAVMASIHHAFQASLRPVSSSADQLGDFQWGYAHWTLLGVSLIFALLRRNREALLLAGIAAGLLILTLPVPFVSSWIWYHLPGSLISITSQWPMQRLYTIACVWLLFAAAKALPDLGRTSGIQKVSYAVMVIAAVAWTVGQSWRFVHRGEKIQQEKTSISDDLHRSENLNLTVTSYAFFQPPPSFMHAPMDPQMELRLLQRGTAEELVTNWTDPSAEQIETQGAFTATENLGDTTLFDSRFVLKPGTKYRLDWSFLASPAEGILRIAGDHFHREYPLPQSGNPQGFGMLPTNRHGITLWSTAPHGDTVHAELIGPRGLPFASSPPLADFTFSRIDEQTLPLRLVSLLPLRVEINPATPAYLETPRMFIEGYKAWVAGKEVRPIRSPAGRVMIPVPAGQSHVKLSYKGTFWLQTAFWFTFSSWGGLFIGLAWWKYFPTSFSRTATRGSNLLSWIFSWRIGMALVLAGALGAGSLYVGFHYMNQAGPIRIRVVLPRGQPGRSHPLLTTGRNGAGTFVYVIYTDATHIRVGFDAWAKDAGQTEPIEIDYFADHEFVISLPALYPEGHWKNRTTSKEDLERLRQRVIVTLDGRTLLNQKAHPFESTYAEITVGENRIGGSTTEPLFSGTILETTRTSPAAILK